MADKYEDWHPWREPIYTEQEIDETQFGGELEEIKPKPTTAQILRALAFLGAKEITPETKLEETCLAAGTRANLTAMLAGAESKEKCYQPGCNCGMEHEAPPVEPPTEIANAGEYALVTGSNAKGDGQMSLMGRKLSDVPMRQQKWLWPGRIPENSVALFSGPVSKGKSTAALSIIACVTLGSDWPDGAVNTMGPRDVLLAATEDDVETAIKPRLAALGADMTRITIIDRVDITPKGGKKQTRQLALKEHTGLLQSALKQNPNIALIVLDPITGFYGSVDGNDNKEIRPMVQNLAKVCRETHVSIIGIVHENKQKDVSAVNQILGAGALSQVVRSGLRFSADPDNKPDGKIMASLKSNLTKSGGGIRFTIEGVDVVVDDGTKTNVGIIRWGEQHGLTADEVMATAGDTPEKAKPGPPDVKTQEACRLITTFYANGPRLLMDAHKVREEADISVDTWKKAAKQLGLEQKKKMDNWWGRLPFAPGTESQQLFWSKNCPANDARLGAVDSSDFPS
jgi:hypothetical protein